MAGNVNIPLCPSATSDTALALAQAHVAGSPNAARRAAHRHIALEAHKAVGTSVERLATAIQRKHGGCSTEKPRVRHKLEADTGRQPALEVVALQSQRVRNFCH